MNILFYDTETTGLPVWGSPSGGDEQPHIVQLAALLVDSETREVLEMVDAIIAPDGWTSSPEALAVHGITHERAMDEGIPESTAMAQLLDLWGRCEWRVGHNESFDARILRIATCRYTDEETQAAWKGGYAKCTARLSSPILKLPPTEAMKRAKRFYPKTPTLLEAYRFFKDADMESAHCPMADTRGCMDVYWGVQDWRDGNP